MPARLLALCVGALLLATPVHAKGMTDAQVRQAIIQDSIASYPGNCPCPYNSARNGSSCGGRSAYSRRGGYAPICYAREIPKADVEAYRRAHGL